MAVPQPLILTDASLKIGTDGTPTSLTELACVASHVELSPDTTITTVDTFCGSTDYPGQTKWSLVATLVQSFDTDATEDVLSAAVAFGDPVPFEVSGYKSQPVGADNPAWSGMVTPAPYAPINGDAGDVSTIDLEWGVIGTPLKSITPGTMAASQDLSALSRADLDTMASGLGLNPADYATKADEIAAIQEAQAAQTTVA